MEISLLLQLQRQFLNLEDLHVSSILKRIVLYAANKWLKKGNFHKFVEKIITTIEFKDRLLEKCDDRKVELGKTVQSRLLNVIDLAAADVNIIRNVPSLQ